MVKVSRVNISARREGSSTGRGWRKTALMMVKMAVLAPMPSARESTTTKVKPGLFLSMRKPPRRSCRKIPAITLPPTQRLGRSPGIFVSGVLSRWGSRRDGNSNRIQERSLGPSAVADPGQTPLVGCLVNNNWPPSPPFSQVLILKVDKVLCFDALLEVLILKVVRSIFGGTFSRVDSNGVAELRQMTDGKARKREQGEEGASWRWYRRKVTTHDTMNYSICQVLL